MTKFHPKEFQSKKNIFFLAVYTSNGLLSIMSPKQDKVVENLTTLLITFWIHRKFSFKIFYLWYEIIIKKSLN